MKIYHIPVYMLIIFGFYHIAFNNIEMPYKPKEMLLKMEKDLAKLEPILGAPSLVSKDYGTVNASVKYDYNDKTSVTEEEVRAAFTKLGWDTKMNQSRYGDYEVFCNKYVQVRYFKIPNNTLRVYSFYSSTTSCFKDEYKTFKTPIGD